MSVFYERCPCGAEFRVEVDTHSDARADLEKFGTNHRHEWAPGDRTTDDTGYFHHTTGFTTERDGRIGDVQ